MVGVLVQNRLTVDAEFKNIPSVGRLHAGTIHRESEALLLALFE